MKRGYALNSYIPYILSPELEIGNCIDVLKDLESAVFNVVISVEPMPRNRFFQKVLKPAGILPRRFLVVEDPAAAMEIVAAGFGIAMAPAWAVRPLVESGRLESLPVTRAGLFLTWYAVFLKNDPNPVFMHEFIRLVGRAGIALPPKQRNKA